MAVPSAFPESHMQMSRVALEACPPLERSRERAFSFLDHVFRCYSRFEIISVPDIQDASEFGRTRKRVDNLDFARWAQQETGKPVLLYKVSVSTTEDELKAWVEQASELDCHDIVIVGGDQSASNYGGLSPGDASKVVQGMGFHTGGIIIPSRRTEFVQRPASRDELGRLLEKIRVWNSGFFTTQILYDSEWMSCLLLEMVRELTEEEIPKIFLTFSPFVCEADIDFAKKHLGVYVPADVERLLRGARNMSEEAIGIILVVWERIATFATEVGIPLDRLGVNVEYLNTRNPRNVRAAFELAEEIGRRLGTP